MPKSFISDAARKRLEQLLDRTHDDYDHFIGFPGALDFDYQELAAIQQHLLNNAGDPTVSTFHGLNTKAMEQEVLAFFAKLFRAKDGSWWGYVTNGSTECNLYALYVARQKFPDALVYYSTAAHYGIAKNVHILGQRGVPIQTTPNGEMDYQDLQRQLSKNAGNPAIIIATIGTTMTEARDDIHRIRQALQSAGVQNNFIHCDAALAGPYAALLEPRHPFDFEDGADSVSISGHKFIGSPMPCGVILVHKADRDLLDGQANYTGSVDTTISGSRNGHTPLVLWYAIQRWGLEGLAERARHSLELAHYTHQRLQHIGWKTWRNPHALTVMLASPPQDLIVKWQLATHDGWSHVICMPGMTETKINKFIADLAG